MARLNLEEDHNIRGNKKQVKRYLDVILSLFSCLSSFTKAEIKSNPPSERELATELIKGTLFNKNLKFKTLLTARKYEVLLTILGNEVDL